MKKLAVLFPGIGYTCDKPLLYYSWKMLSGMGYEIVPVPYTGFQKNIKGNADRMKNAAQMALDQAEEMLNPVRWPEYEDIIFVSKSIGTVVAAAYTQRHWIQTRHVMFTPVEAAFQYTARNVIAFHGTGDPWAETEKIEENCRRLGIPLYETVGANHSLETGDVDRDIETLRKTMLIVRAFAEGKEPEIRKHQEELRRQGL